MLSDVPTNKYKSAIDTKISTNNYGFRKWGNLKSLSLKIFIVGDSFTMSMYASDNQTYYSILADNLDTEVFTYGCSGYGTLQEYMIINKYFDTIKPDIVILDVSLKSSSGIELLKDIKSQYPKLPVLVLSMFDEALYAERALRAGAMEAAIATPPSKSGTPTKETRSVLPIPIRKLEMSWLRPNATARPMTLPTDTSPKLPRRTILTTELASAPRDIRIPISRDRRATV